MKFKLTLLKLLFSLSVFSQNTTNKLSSSQLDQIERGYEMFIHF